MADKDYKPGYEDVEFTEEIDVPDKLIDQVIGQESGVEIIRKAAEQGRNVLLIGSPGTGKSMLAKAMSELLPTEKLQDILAYPNQDDPNEPQIETVPAGEGEKIVEQKKKVVSKQSMKGMKPKMSPFLIMGLLYALGIGAAIHFNLFSDVILAAVMIVGGIFLAMLSFGLALTSGLQGMRMPGGKTQAKKNSPKLLVDNSDQEKAPFVDATGARAGALLGDVKHDPFQCFSPSDTSIYAKKDSDNIIGETSLGNEIDDIMQKYPDKIQTREDRDYEALHLPSNELELLGEENSSASMVRALSSNRHYYKGEMVKITTSEDKEIIVTPEHQIAVWNDGEIKYKEAREVKEGEQAVTKSEGIIIDEQDIINTYNERQKEQCRLYHEYEKISEENPEWGYKRIAKSMGQKIGKTRWWHAGKHKPQPIQTAEWLKEKGLLPLTIDNPKLPLIAKALGATFGDGGIFKNLNAVFLSSSEKEATEEFGQDLIEIFGEEIDKNSRTIEAGIEGHSWCYQNTNRKVIRFLKALGAPIGKKTEIKLKLPNWVTLRDDLKDEFYGSFLGGELGAPKVHKEKNRLQTLDIGITGNKKLQQNRKRFLRKMERFLEEKGVECTSLLEREHNENSVLYRLMMSVKFGNVINFVENVKINYCNYKKEKIVNAINRLSHLKKEKYEELISEGYGAEHAMKLLKVTPSSMYHILNEKKIKPEMQL